MLPPGQQEIAGFPRFGAHLGHPPPTPPADPVIEIAGAVAEPSAFSVADLATLPPRGVTADFHCVAGWTATGLTWEGVGFRDFYREVVRATARPEGSVSHLVFEGLDGYRSIVGLDDALAEDVLLATHLDGRPLDGDHGAPVRLLSPGQYGYISTKHLCRIELHTREPALRYHRSSSTDRRLQLVKPHPRARVWEEERHRYVPAWALRHLYRRLIPRVTAMSEREDRTGRTPPPGETA